MLRKIITGLARQRYAQFYRTSVDAQSLLDKPYDKPVLMAASQHDSVLDTEFLLKVFQDKFTHPKSRLIWYGSEPHSQAKDNRILVRTDSLPEYRISQFSHMEILFITIQLAIRSRGAVENLFKWDGCSTKRSL